MISIYITKNHHFLKEMKRWRDVTVDKIDTFMHNLILPWNWLKFSCFQDGPIVQVHWYRQARVPTRIRHLTEEVRRASVGIIKHGTVVKNKTKAIQLKLYTISHNFSGSWNVNWVHRNVLPQLKFHGLTGNVPAMQFVRKQLSKFQQQCITHHHKQLTLTLTRWLPETFNFKLVYP